MKKVCLIFSFIFALCLSFLPVNAQMPSVYYVTVDYDQGSVKIADVSMGTGYASDKNVDVNQPFYWLELLSFSGETLEDKQFNIYLQISYEPPVEGEANTVGGTAVLDRQKEIVILPYHKDGYVMNLYDANRNLLGTKDVTYLADICGDKICQEHESYENCQQDCPPAGKDDYCNMDKINEDPDCAPIVEAQKQNNQINSEERGFLEKNKLWFIGLGVFLLAVLLIIVIVYYIRRGRDGNSDNNNGVQYT